MIVFTVHEIAKYLPVMSLAFYVNKDFTYIHTAACVFLQANFFFLFVTKKQTFVEINQPVILLHA